MSTNKVHIKILRR